MGLELGVNRGEFSNAILERWPKCKSYLLVDPYDLRPRTYTSMKTYLSERFGQVPVFMRMNDREALTHIEDNSLDFMYLDANHDYCSLKEQLATYWPKLKKGGQFSKLSTFTFQVSFRVTTMCT